MKLIKGSKLVTDKKLRAFRELNVDFIGLSPSMARNRSPISSSSANESRLFTFGRRDNVIPNLYFPDSDLILNNELARTAKQVVSMLLTAGELPYVRYAAKGKNRMCEAFATFLDVSVAHSCRLLESIGPCWPIRICVP